MQFLLRNDLVSSILNGPVLHIDFVPDIAIYSFLISVLLGLIASVYPVETAVRLEPVVAVHRG
jgi:ABC-type lipoprotein release transport system permease subunit